MSFISLWFSLVFKIAGSMPRNSCKVVSPNSSICREKNRSRMRAYLLQIIIFVHDTVEAESYGYRAIECLYMYQRHFLSDWNIDPKYVSSRPQWMSIHVVISSWHSPSFEADSNGYRAIECLWMYQRHFLSDWNIDPKYVSSRPQWMSIHVVVVWNPTPLSPRCHFDDSLGFLFTLVAHRYFLLRDHKTYSL